MRKCFGTQLFQYISTNQNTEIITALARSKQASASYYNSFKTNHIAEYMQDRHQT